MGTRAGKQITGKEWDKRRDLIRDLRDEGWKWVEIGRIFGITASHVQTVAKFRNIYGVPEKKYAKGDRRR